MRYSECSDWRLTTETLPLYKESVTEPRYIFLCGFDESIERFAKRCEPESEVDQFRIF